jgi:hypothetical protein
MMIMMMMIRIILLRKKKNDETGDELPLKFLFTVEYHYWNIKIKG